MVGRDYNTPEETQAQPIERNTSLNWTCLPNHLTSTYNEIDTHISVCPGTIFDAL